MTEHADILSAFADIVIEEYPAYDHAEIHGFKPGPGRTRHEGWTPAARRMFLEALSEGRNVVQCCEIVGLSKQSAYALRSAPRGQAFALGWDAAVLKARDALADELMDRAFNGVRESAERSDGTVVTRHRHDNRLAMQMLARLDRMADAQAGPGGSAAARMVATDFAQYLELIGRDAGPARAGVFLGARIEPAGEDDLAPIRALARADRWLRTHTDVAEPLATADLDPAERAGWTAEQWLRAEAAGLVAMAPSPPETAAPENMESSQASQPDGARQPLWWCEHADEWRTHFPPPEGFCGYEDGEYGNEDYSRALSPEERAAVEADIARDIAAQRAVETIARDAWLRALLAGQVPADEAGTGGAGAEEAGMGTAPHGGG